MSKQLETLLEKALKTGSASYRPSLDKFSVLADFGKGRLEERAV